jgi:hypothetical protein
MEFNALVLFLYFIETGDSRQRAEEREYYQDVDTLYNTTAWATLKAMLS